MFLKKLVLKNKPKNPATYPFTVPAIQTLEQLSFDQKVTFFVGENGSGKSTLLEAIAVQCGFPVGGGGRNNRYNYVEETSPLAEHITLSWLPKIHNGFFLRAESFHQFVSHVDEVGANNAYGGQSMHQQPEAALSPQRQLTFLKMLHDFVEQYDCQFIIATHSPILLGYPNAVIYSFDENICEVAYEDTEHYQISKYFLMNRDRFLQKLFEE